MGSKRDWLISVTVFGEANPQGLIKRSGAKVGDLLVMTGPLGLAGAGLEALQSGYQGRPQPSAAGRGRRRPGEAKAWAQPLIDAFSRPRPRLAAGQYLGRGQLATSLMDCSDGLEASVRILAESSGVGAEIDLSKLVIPPALERWAKYRGQRAWSYALSGGEDYELIFTVRPALWSQVQRQLRGVIRIGQILRRSHGCSAMCPDGKRIPLKGYGFSHF